MGYLDRQLNKGEKVAAKAHKSNWIFLRELLFVLITVGVYLLLSKVIIKNAAVAKYAAIAFGGITLILFATHLFALISTEIVVTNNKLAYKQGLLFVKQADILLKSVDCVEIKYTMIGRMLGYGKLIIRTDSKVFELKQLAKPSKFAQKINKQAVKSTKISLTVTNPESGQQMPFTPEMFQQMPAMMAPQQQNLPPRHIVITFGMTPQQQRLTESLLRKSNARNQQLKAMGATIPGTAPATAADTAAE